MLNKLERSMKQDPVPFPDGTNGLNPALPPPPRDTLNPAKGYPQSAGDESPPVFPPRPFPGRFPLPAFGKGSGSGIRHNNYQPEGFCRFHQTWVTEEDCQRCGDYEPAENEKPGRLENCGYSMSADSEDEDDEMPGLDDDEGE